MPADDDDIGDSSHPVIDEELRISEPCLLCDVGRNHRFPRTQAMALGRILGSHDGCDANNAWRPTHARAHKHGLAVFLKLDNLGQIRSKRLARKTAGLSEDLVKVIGFKRQFPEPREYSLKLQRSVCIWSF